MFLKEWEIRENFFKDKASVCERQLYGGGSLIRILEVCLLHCFGNKIFGDRRCDFPDQWDDRENKPLLGAVLAAIFSPPNPINFRQKCKIDNR